MPSINMISNSIALAPSTSVAASITPSTTSPTPGMSMPGMDMGGSADCRSSMFWNWYVLDACFLSPSWHITSHGMFVGSCVGVIGLVVFLEFLRRLQREYDRNIFHRSRQRANVDSKAGDNSGNTSTIDRTGDGSYDDPPHSAVPLLGDWERNLQLRRPGHLLPNLFQQAVRASLFTLQFAVAYMIMLLAMYYNGYILACILIGGFLGFFIFSRDTFGPASMSSSDNAACCT